MFFLNVIVPIITSINYRKLMKEQVMKILRLKEVVELTGLSKATIYRYIKNERFPKQVQLSARAIGFRSSDISAWIEGLK